MAKITIKDLPKDVKVSLEEMRRVLGGTTMRRNPYSRSIIIHTEPGPTPPESETHGYHTSEDGFVIVY